MTFRGIDGESRIGLFGKIPAQADFLRLQSGELAATGLDEWFQQGYEAVHGSGVPLPSETFRFVLAPAAGAPVCLGAMRASRDAAGRTFPLVAFTFADPIALANELPWVAHTRAVLFAIAEDLLETAQVAPAAELAELLGATPPLSTNAVDAQAALAAEPLWPLSQAIGAPPRGAAYAFRTLRLACEQARKGAAPTIGAVAPTLGARALWLLLAQRLLPTTPLSFFWTEAPTHRLLVSLGPPAPAVLGFVANPASRSQRYWPLRTELEGALGEALAVLSAAQRQVIESPTASLLDALVAFG